MVSSSPGYVLTFSRSSILLHAGPAIMHGISGVLMPNLPPDPNELPPPKKGDPSDLARPQDDPNTPAEEVGLAGPDSEETEGDDNGPEQLPTAQPGRAAGTALGTAGTAGRTNISPKQGVRGSPNLPGAVTVESGSGRASAAQMQPTTAAPNGNSAAVPRRPVLRGPTPTTAADGEAGNRRRLVQLPGEARDLSKGMQTARQLFGERALQQTSRPSTKARPQGTTATVSGALTSVARVGAMGELQSFPNGIATNKTLVALARAAVPQVPKVYVNRYGGFKGPDVRGGCLNCKAWGKQTQ